MNNETLPGPPLKGENGRLQWLDAMRGFTMILVVANHVALNSFGERFSASSAMSLLVLLRMPLFFFISGFLAYKAGLVWDIAGTWGRIKKKLRVQIIPTVVFFLVFMAVCHARTFGTSVVEALHSPTKGGYWFTIALLYMFLVYYVFEYVEHLFRRQTVWPILVLWLLALCLYESCYLPRHFAWATGRRVPYTGWLCDISMVQFMQYFHFFVFGNIVRRYWHRFQRLYDRPGFYLLIVLVAFLSSVEFLKVHWLRLSWANITHTLASYSLLTLVFLFFRYYQESFSDRHLLGRGLQYVGTRTLDVYLIHYLFLPSIPEVGAFFNTHPGNFVLDISLSLAVALLVVAFCLLTSNVLRISPFLKKYLFGRG